MINEHLVDIANEKIAKPRNLKVLKNANGDTIDIINVVLSTGALYNNDTRNFAAYLKGGTDLQTCKNIWEFVKINIKYVVDPSGYQFVKSPALTWAERKKGCDCKSYSIFIGSLLHNLKINYCYRFVSFSPNIKTPTHVYVVAFVNGKEIIIDDVLNAFNTEKPYKHKIDHTMSQIYQMSGIGNAEQKVLNLGNKDLGDMSEGELDLWLARGRMIAEKEAIESLTGVGSLKAEKYQDSIDMLEDAITAVQEATVDGIGDIEDTLNDIANDAMNGIYSIANKVAGIGAAKGKAVRQAKKAERKVVTAKAKELKKSGDKAGAKALKATVQTKTGKLLKNVATKVKTGAKAITKVATAPVRLLLKGILEVTLPKASPFFLYLFINDATVIAKLPAKVKAKRSNAEKIANFIVEGLGIKRDHFMSVIRTGILKQYKKQPEQVIAEQIKGIAGIGDIFTVVKFVIEIIKKISKVLGKKGPDVSDSDAPSGDDFGGADTKLANDIKNQPSNKNIVDDNEPGYDGNGGKKVWSSL